MENKDADRAKDPILVKFPTLCLNMIVKNEILVIKDCLDSVIKHFGKYLVHWVIVDTGSTDGTQDYIRYIMRNIPGTLYERPWVNFSHNREEALQLVPLSVADFVFFIDADETIVFYDGVKVEDVLYEMCTDADMVLCHIDEGMKVTRRQYAVRNNGLQFWAKDIIHEYMTTMNPFMKVHFNPYFKIKAYATQASGRNLAQQGGSVEKYAKDAALIQEQWDIELKKDPKDRNYRHELTLSQSLFNSRQFNKALGVYKSIIANPLHSNESRYVAAFYTAHLLHTFGQDGKPVNTERLKRLYLLAYKIRPTRNEPLFRLALLSMKEKNWKAALHNFALCLAKPPTDDMAFVEVQCYSPEVLQPFIDQCKKLIHMESHCVAK